MQSNLPAWLHRCAVNIAISHRRRVSARERRETLSVSSEACVTDRGVGDASDRVEMVRLLDESLAEIADEAVRGLLIEHFFLGRSQHQIAAELGGSQPAVSKRIDKGVSVLRENLAKRGITTSAGTLVVVLNGIFTDDAAATIDVDRLVSTALSGVSRHDAHPWAWLATWSSTATTVALIVLVAGGVAVAVWGVMSQSAPQSSPLGMAAIWNSYTYFGNQMRSFPIRRIAIWPTSDDERLRTEAVKLRDLLMAADDVDEVVFYPFGMAPADGIRSPDVTIWLALLTIADSGDITLGAEVWAGGGLEWMPHGGQLPARHRLQPHALMRAFMFVAQPHVSMPVSYDVGRDEFGPQVVQHLVHLRRACGESAGFPESFYPTFRPAPAFRFLEQNDARLVMSGRRFMTPNETVWTLTADKPISMLLSKINAELSSEGWQVSLNSETFRLTAFDRDMRRQFDVFPEYGNDVDELYCPRGVNGGFGFKTAEHPAIFVRYVESDILASSDELKQKVADAFDEGTRHRILLPFIDFWPVEEREWLQRSWRDMGLVTGPEWYRTGCVLDDTGDTSSAVEAFRYAAQWNQEAANSDGWLGLAIWTRLSTIQAAGPRRIPISWPEFGYHEIVDGKVAPVTLVENQTVDYHMQAPDVAKPTLLSFRIKPTAIIGNANVPSHWLEIRSTAGDTVMNYTTRGIVANPFTMRLDPEIWDGVSVQCTVTQRDTASNQFALTVSIAR